MAEQAIGNSTVVDGAGCSGDVFAGGDLKMATSHRVELTTSNQPAWLVSLNRP